MRAAALLALAAMLPACMFVVPKDRKTEVRRTPHWHDPLRIGPPVPTVAGQVRGTGIDVTVTLKQLCDIKGDLVIEHRIHTGATLKVYDPCGGASGDCGYLIIFGIFSAPFTIGISGLITLGTVIAADDRTESTTQPLPTKRVPCDQPGAGYRVLVAAPGREPQRVITDPGGRAYVELGEQAVALQATVQLDLTP
jgi:hypothetical protein